MFSVQISIIFENKDCPTEFLAFNSTINMQTQKRPSKFESSQCMV
ncbi:hypothetical protein [Desulfurella sp.]